MYMYTSLDTDGDMTMMLMTVSETVMIVDSKSDNMVNREYRT